MTDELRERAIRDVAEFMRYDPDSMKEFWLDTPGETYKPIKYAVSQGEAVLGLEQQDQAIHYGSKFVWTLISKEKP